MRYAWDMSQSAGFNFSHLPAAERRLGAAFARPKFVAIACVIALTLLGWLSLALMTAQMDGVVAALCRPSFAAAGLWSGGGFVVVALMWATMMLVMMMPSAAPMILTYAEIAETAAHKGERIVSPFVIAAGYSVVWLGFAHIAALAQLALTRTALLDSGMATASALLSGAIFIGAGLYQFSALKLACLTQCRQPFSFFFTHWETTRRGVFKLGLSQGLYCLGCCWAMMLVMFAVGVMNVLWMVVLGVAMTVEKIARGKWLTYGVGAALIAIGVAFVVASFAAHWPLRAI
jgi:predicted metal-binding membrane protein